MRRVSPLVASKGSSLAFPLPLPQVWRIEGEDHGLVRILSWEWERPPCRKADILRTLLLVVSIVILGPLTDASKIYHSIRGQDTIKLYVIFNALEVC